MIIVIRIAGKVGRTEEVEETLFRMRLRKKYVAVLLHDTEKNRELIKSVHQFVAYGTISPETMKDLIEARGQGIDGKKIDASKIASQLDKKSLEELGVKPFFRLHPPRKGIESKKPFGVGKGVLGNHKEAINELVERML